MPCSMRHRFCLSRYFRSASSRSQFKEDNELRQSTLAVHWSIATAISPQPPPPSPSQTVGSPRHRRRPVVSPSVNTTYVTGPSPSPQPPHRHRHTTTLPHFHSHTVGRQKRKPTLPAQYEMPAPAHRSWSVAADPSPSLAPTYATLGEVARAFWCGGPSCAGLPFWRKHIFYPSPP